VRADGPVDLPHIPTGAVYHRFLYNIPVLLEYLLVHREQHMYFMHDGTPPHFSLHCQHLNQTIGSQWIGRTDCGPYCFQFT
jgi:hypothetical protein